ncbi:MAG: hypothetical protein HQL82_13180 [Magnetococcales bacterium]|nr:hypothetical protein [Magnetococcales bacterium]
MNRFLVAIALLAAVPGSAWAHGTAEASHGGRMAEAGGYRLELTATDQGVDLYVTDHDNRPVALDQAGGRVTLLTGGDKVKIALAPTAGNRLSHAGPVAGANAAAAVIVVEGLPQPVSARLPAVGP